MSEELVDPTEYDTVCTECYAVFKNSYKITCNYCHGVTTQVYAGSGEATKKALKERGRGSNSINL